MRHLNRKQKNILDKWLQENSHLPGLAVCDAIQDHFDYDFWQYFQELNDFETIYSVTNRYINDNAEKYSPKANPHFTNNLGL